MLNLKLNTPKSHPAGVSLPLVVTLIILIMIAAATANQIIIRSLRTADNIEDSERAYFAAEAGIEDALYELSAHFPGYETPDLDSAQVRTADFSDSGVEWSNQWDIKNIEPTGNFSGKLYAGDKLNLHFFEDDTGVQTDPNAISLANSSISPVEVFNDFQLTFSVPFDTPSGYSDFFTTLNTLNIDNDLDLGITTTQGPEGIDGLNEDGRAERQDCGDGFISEDGDCDGSQDEDSQEDPVVTCQVLDDNGHTWQPVDGCLTGLGTDDDPEGGEICEKDFTDNLEGVIQASIDHNTPGIDLVDQSPVTLGAFIEPGYLGRSNESQVSMECIIVAPLVQVNPVTEVKKELPYLEYQVNSTVESGSGLPLPTFTIHSDGWYRDFKQSITTQLIPGETVPLLDITIIQQN